MRVQKRLHNGATYVWRDVKTLDDYDTAVEALAEFRAIDPHHEYRLINVILD